jgi:hypothetical protein
MKGEIHKVKSKVWLYPGMSGWHFANVDKKQSATLKEKYLSACNAQAGGRGSRGFGSIPVEVTLGKTKWETSIFPDKQSGTYVLPLKAKVRKDEGVFADDKINFTFTVRT